MCEINEQADALSQHAWRTSNHAAYLDHWLSVLKEDKRAIFSAAAHAQRAGDYLSDLQPKRQEAERTEAA